MGLWEERGEAWNGDVLGEKIADGARSVGIVVPYISFGVKLWIPLADVGLEIGEGQVYHRDDKDFGYNNIAVFVDYNGVSDHKGTLILRLRNRVRRDEARGCEQAGTED